MLEWCSTDVKRGQIEMNNYADETGENAGMGREEGGHEGHKVYTYDKKESCKFLRAPVQSSRSSWPASSLTQPFIQSQILTFASLNTKPFQMKTLLKNRAILPAIVCAIVIFSLASCSTKKLTFANSYITPAATGQVSVKNDKNGNYTIRISLRNLAPASRLNPPAKTYIAWAQTANGAKNIGRFNPSGKSLKASLSTNFPFKPEKVFVTAEDSPDVVIPSGAIILTTN